jgi:hypothetical protein
VNVTATLYVDVEINGSLTVNEWINDIDSVNTMINQSALRNDIDNAALAMGQLIANPTGDRCTTEQLDAEITQMWNNYIRLVVQAAEQAGWTVVHNR